MEVKVYSKDNCTFCVQAKALLRSKGVPFEEILLNDDEKRAQFYKECGPGVRSMPQIFVDGVRIGGFRELQQSDVFTRAAASNFDEEF